MKKFLGLLTALTLFAACGGSDSNNQTEPDAEPADAGDAGDAENDVGEDTGPGPGCLIAFDCGVTEARPSVLVEPPRFRAVPIPVTGEVLYNSAGHDVNDVGQMTGAIRFENSAPQNGRTSPFRFSEAGGFEEIQNAGGGQGLAINASGMVTGFAWSGGEMVAFVASGTNAQLIGQQHTTGASHGSDINDEGVVAGFCQVEGHQRPCVYTPGEGWNVLDFGGSARGVTDDGTIYGLSSTLTSNAFRWTEAGGVEEVGVAEVHRSFPEAVSDDGAHLALQRDNRRIIDIGDAVVYRLASGAPLAIDDPDDQPLRKLESRIWDINNDGWAVGHSLDRMGRAVGWLYDPRSGQTHDLHELVDFPEGRWQLKQAHGISNTGFIAATAGINLDMPENFAMLLVPYDWPEPVGASLPGRDSGQPSSFEAIWAPIDDTAAPRLKNTAAFGITDDFRLAVVSDDYDTAVNSAWERPAWLDSTGNITLYGEWMADLPVNVSGAGQLVGTAMVLEEFTDIRRFYAATSTGGALESLGTLPGYLDSFGYGINESGQVIAECLGEPGMRACLYDPQLGWSGLFDGEAYAISDTGVVTGATADDGVLFVDGGVTELGLGEGARATTISRDGRFVAGVFGHAFVYDRDEDVLDWLPDLYGDPATVGRVEPRAVSNGGVVVGTAYDVSGEKYAFRYDPNTGVMDRLEWLLDGQVRLREAVGINASGWIAATALMPNGATRAVMLQPVDSGG